MTTYQMFYTVYKITNKINGKIYIGAHSTSSLDDGYMGSGSAITSAIRKYGLDSFEKEILHVFDNPEEMYLKEACIVDEAFVLDRENYNLKVGGTGGWDYINRLGLSITESHRQSVLRNLEKKQQGYLSWYASHDPQEMSEKIKEGRRKSTKVPGSFAGMNHTEASKAAIGAANKVAQSGKGNSQYGTKWAVNPDTGLAEKVRVGDLSLLLSQGWIAGRKIKPSSK